MKAAVTRIVNFQQKIWKIHIYKQLRDAVGGFSELGYLVYK